MGIKRKSSNPDGTCILKQGISISSSAQVPRGTASAGLVDALLELFPVRFPTKTSAKRAVRRKMVLVDNKSCKVDDMVQAGQIVALLDRTVAGSDLNPEQAPVKIQVVYEDDQIACVIKPPGIKTQGIGNTAPTLSSCLKYVLKPGKGIGLLHRPREAHRLDSVTGGLVLAAKSCKSLELLAGAFSERKIQKRYRTIVYGEVTEQKGTIDKTLSDKESVTDYEVIEVLVAKDGSEKKITVVDVWPKTGRYHQIRRHLAHIGHPIYGDPLFEENGERRGAKRRKLPPKEEDTTANETNDIKQNGEKNGGLQQFVEITDSGDEGKDDELAWSDVSIDDELKTSIRKRISVQSTGQTEVDQQSVEKQVDKESKETQGQKNKQEVPEVNISVGQKDILEDSFNGEVMLWAAGLQFVHPLDGRQFKIDLEQPRYFSTVKENYVRVSTLNQTQ
eukprot:TRINITY_DN2817_c0_g1_i3.p2 TRINITY_DN2817_c0_g1~~TRINITY_DN2817_c0_g1_i3.p2  ORF type:complete len:475 (+),score=57.60 TRINITY_DN2817_c0_g1_i3:87-1427(+)